jgi:Domain of unknown function (DUF1887)
MPELHLCIATGQNAANFIPLKQLGAQEIRILETPDMAALHSGANLKAALAPYAGQVKRLVFDDATPKRIKASALAVANALDGRDVVFHVTGGTKLMVLALHEQLKLLESGTGSLRLLYADTQHHMLDWLDDTPRQEPMQDVLTLNDLLLVRGYRSTNDTRPAKDQQRAAERAAVSRYMGEQAQALRGFFSTLAYKASLASEGGGLVQRFDYPPGGAPAKLLALAVKNDLLKWSAGGIDVSFADRDSARFFAGGWTEEYVFLKMTGLLNAGQYALNVKVIQNQFKSENEVDAIAVKNNRALLVECKSGKQDKAQEAIYKLGQVVRQVGGLMAKGLYASAQAVSEADRSRANEYGIDVLAGEELQTVNQYLRDWAKA